MQRRISSLAQGRAVFKRCRGSSERRILAKRGVQGEGFKKKVRKRMSSNIRTKTDTGRQDEYSNGDRENYGKGTRQNDSVTSGKGGPPRLRARGDIKESQPTVYQKHRTLRTGITGCIESDACSVPEGQSEGLA